MAFVVEDGTGLASANSYVTVEFADDYFSDRNNSSWAGSNSIKQAALIKATDYIETRWGSRFMGRKEFPETPQALSFPRVNIFDRDGYLVKGLPENLKRATAEYALRSLTAQLLPDPVIDETGLPISSKSEKVGPLEETTMFQTKDSIPVLLRSYPAADKLLTEYVTSTGSNYR